MANRINANAGGILTTGHWIPIERGALTWPVGSHQCKVDSKPFHLKSVPRDLVPPEEADEDITVVRWT